MQTLVLSTTPGSDSPFSSTDMAVSESLRSQLTELELHS